MKQQVSPAVVAIVLAVVAVAVGLFFWRGSSARSSEDLNKSIEASVAKPAMPGAGGPPPSVTGPGGGGPGIQSGGAPTPMPPGGR